MSRRCRRYHLPLWQCPELLFVLMGAVTILVVLVFFSIFSGTLDPYRVALISLGLAAFLVTQSFILVQAFERIAEANRMQVEFMNIASHQLRSPLTAARWALDLVTSEVSRGLSAEAQQCVHIASDAIAHLGQLVGTILRLVRIEADAMSGRSEVIVLNDALRQVVESVRRYAHAANIELVSRLPARMLFVRADPDQVRYVIERLVDNALQYSKGSKGSSTVSVELREERGAAKVMVTDEGAGIPDAEQAHIFEKFFRASNAYLLQPEGSGLSLYVARAIVERLGGKMGFTSRQGVGSTFWFTIPLVAGEPHGSAADV